MLRALSMLYDKCLSLKIGTIDWQEVRINWSYADHPQKFHVMTTRSMLLSLVSLSSTFIQLMLTRLLRKCFVSRKWGDDYF